MSMTAIDQEPGSSAGQWLRGLWEYYRGYTQTAVHAVATAALTGFGLLIFIDPLFAILAIASYFCPPVILYALDADLGKPPTPLENTVRRADSEEDTGSGFDPDSNRDDGDSDDGDTDSDGADSDTDSDGADSDTDSDGADSDTDSDGADSDTDSDGADSDTDSDGTGTDTDG